MSPKALLPHVPRREGFRQADAVEHLGGFVAHAEHHAVQAAFRFGQAVGAGLMREAAGAGRERERAAGQPDDVAIADVHRGQRQPIAAVARSEEHTSELQSLMRISYAVFGLKTKISRAASHVHITTNYQRD